MIAVLIANIDPVPMYFSIKVGRQNGATVGWTPDRTKATAFARTKDAREFVEGYMPFAVPNCQYLACEVDNT